MMSTGFSVRCLRTVSLFALLALHAGTRADETPLLHELFQDHAVLQRDKPIVLWGTTQPRAQLTLTLADASAHVMANESGAWTATLSPMKAGGPYRLTVESAGRQQRVEDILVGDVWLCSGQSNMALQVHRTLDSRSEIAGSTNDAIRMLTVPLISSLAPKEHFGRAVEWLKAEPRNVPEFSATCFYFARELQKTTHVPMGLLNVSWGGSRIEAWMSDSALRSVAGYGDALDLLALYAKDPATAKQAWGKRWEKWWRSRASAPAREPWGRSRYSEWRLAPPGLGAWEKWRIPELADYDGMLWYRTRVNITAAQARQKVSLALGRIDEVDHVWVNGQFVDTSSGADVPRVYPLDPKLLRSGENEIVVNVLDTYGDGGLTGSPRDRALTLGDGSTIALDHDWYFQKVAADSGSPPRPPWESVAGLTTIHNAMIAPLRQLGLKGVVWYQGEANTNNADSYQALLVALMSDWRSKYGADLPFLIVQLANFGLPPSAPTESGWAALREAQRLAVNDDAHAALSVTIDIGDRYDIHPANKQEVGRRLSRAARHLIEHESIAASGPVALSARKLSGKVEVNFGDVQDELIAYGAQQPIGFELCGAAPRSCRFVAAEIVGKNVLLTDDSRNLATRVRYCWADSPVCTLYDRSPLPAGPFELTIAGQERR